MTERKWVAREHCGGERGSILPLVAGYLALAGLVVLAGVSVTSLYIEHKQLLSLADAAALAATEAFTVEQFSREGESLSPRLRSELVREVAQLVLAEAQRPELRLVSAESVDARSATVTIATVWQPPILSVLLPAAVPVEVSSTARTVFD